MKPKHWMHKLKLKPMPGFLTKEEKDILKLLAKLEDKSLQRYITRIIQRHIGENKHKIES